jgi:hypothetical protein
VPRPEAHARNAPTVLADKTRRSADSRKVAAKRQPRKRDYCNAQTQLLQKTVIDRPISAAIGAQLRALFDKVAQEPLPVRFASLLQKLESTNDR